MSSDAEWLVARTELRALLRTQPSWTNGDFADALHRSLGWVKKWRKRIQAAPDDEQVLHSRSRARLHPPPKLAQAVIDAVLALRENPPEHLQRVPGPKAILYYLSRDPQLKARGLRLPRSTRTIWQILRSAGRIARPLSRAHQPVERPEPMTSWQLDFKDVTSVPAEAQGKRQHVVEVLDIVDVGSSILVDAHVRPDFTAETTLRTVVETLRTHGLPDSITMDRDPRFIGNTQGRDFPCPLLRLLYSLGLHITICPAKRPDLNAFVERYHRTFEHECIRIVGPSDLESAKQATATFRQHYNEERPNQALSCGNRPPAIAFADLPPRPVLPTMLDPDRWLAVLDGERYVRKVMGNGTVVIDNSYYYVGQSSVGKHVRLRLDAAKRVFVVEYREKVIKQLPIKGLLGEAIALDTYVELMAQAARTQYIAGRPIGRQLQLPLETSDTPATPKATM
jgi:hypothetical protein